MCLRMRSGTSFPSPRLPKPKKRISSRISPAVACSDGSPGDLLQPARESAEVLAALRQTLGEFSFASQYQQNPIPLGGSIVKLDWLRYFDPGEEPTRFSIVIQSWDTANKSGELNDFSVCTTWGYLKGRFYLLDVCRKRLEFPNLKRQVRRLYEKFGPQKILIEDKGSGT
jgi:hypothetical protein